MMSRRNILAGLVSAAALLASRASIAAGVLPDTVDDKLEWDDCLARMKALANRFATGRIGQNDMERAGLRLISRLDINAASFERAVATSYESGNLFWLWQRMTKSVRMDGGILNIDDRQMIPLHDHPGATGMVRIISGEAEVWKLERVDADRGRPGKAQLEVLFRGILRPGDTATVTPENGNIHALRSVSKECRMLDFFIPPFDRASLLFFAPDDKNWFGKQQISCRAIPRTRFTRS